MARLALCIALGMALPPAGLPALAAATAPPATAASAPASAAGSAGALTATASPHGATSTTSPAGATSTATTEAPLLLARDRGTRGGGRGGGHGRRERSGFGNGRASLDRGNRRPDGGWSRRIGEGDRARREFDRARRDLSSRDLENRGRRWVDEGIDRDRVRRSFDRVDRNWDRARREVRDLDLDRRVDRALDRGVDRALDRADRAVDRVRNWDDHWPGWVRPGWNLARPWRAGWYGDWNRPPWGWWGARSLAWGVGSLATAAVINNAVNDAITASRPTIVVPDAGYSLYVNSVEVSGDETVRFTAATGETRFEATADCRQGALNGREPASAAQAQLLHAACQVAFGS